MTKVLIPRKVANAFDEFLRAFCKLSAEDVALMLMAIPSMNTSGNTKILKNFALENPLLYLQAIVNGYEAKISIQEELEDMLAAWLSKPYEDNEEQDIREFARKIENYFQLQK